MSTQQFPSDPNRMSVDKTMVEGSNPASPPTRQTPLTPGARTTVGATRTSSKTLVSGTPQSIEGLPSGNEPEPLGSGSVVGVLGTGGMARVYKVWNEKLEVHRAVKVLLPNAQGDLRSRFETEGKITAKLRHPNVIEIYAVGDWRGLPFLEMELIDGESLEAVINQQGKLPDVLCSAIAIMVSRALNYAHTQKVLIYGKTYNGIIHRDLKPANIMISRTGDVKLMDFGIARPTETSLHTVEGNIVGTLPYLAPEQIDGMDMDNRVDIYACGTILYEMLTGSKTFPQNTITNLMKSKITNEYRRFEDFQFGVAPALAKIAQKCLQVSKENRYTTSGELLAALEAAHKKMTDESPEKVLRTYRDAPDSIESSTSTKRPSQIFKPVIVLPAAGVVALSILIVVLLLTGPKSKDKAATPAVKPPAAVVVQVPATPPIMTPAPEEILTPLGSPPPSSPPTAATPARPIPRPAAAAPVPRPVAPKPQALVEKPKPTPESSGSPLDQLKQKYGDDDLFSVGQSAFQKRQYADALAALESLPKGHPRSLERDIMILEALVETGRLGDAVDLSEGSSVSDAQFSLTRGKMYLRTKNYSDALKHLQVAMQVRSEMRSRPEIVKDALFYTAQVRSALYRSDQTTDSRAAALQAWVSAKRALEKSPDDPRYKKSVEELANIK